MMMKTRNGQSLVEFALVLPLLLMLTFGLIEFGLIMYDKAVITNASREGARVGIVAQDRTCVGCLDAIKATIVTTVNNYCASYLITFGSVSLTTNDPHQFDNGTTFGSPVTVTVQYTYGFLVIPRFITSLTGPLVLQATTVMKLE